MSKFIMARQWSTPNDCQNHPNYLYVFGDNDIGKGCGGQAVIRNQPNSLGIPTKKYPSNYPQSFYNDSEYLVNVSKINRALTKLITEATHYDQVIFPKDGLGTGLSQLPTKAPQTYHYLVTKIYELFGITYQ